MNSGLIIGILAAFTIGTVLLILLYHFGTMLRDPKMRFHIGNVAADGKAAATESAESDVKEIALPLTVRLDHSIASEHPANPSAR